MCWTRRSAAGGRVRRGPRIQGELLKALGQTYMGLGLYDRAGKVFKKAHSAYRATLGPDHPDTLACLHNLGESYRLARRLAEGFCRSRRRLRRRKAALGPGNPDTLDSMHGLALAYLATGRRDEGIRLLKRC